MSNEKTIPKVSLDVVFKCGECLHHRVNPHPSKKALCIKEGVRPFAVAPKCFTPDVTQLSQNSDTFVQLALILSEYTPKQQRILFGVLRQRPIKKRRFSRELPFASKVYFLALGADYFSNYLSGYVMGLTSGGDLIITGSPEQNTRGRTYMAYMTDDDNLLTAKEWRIKKKELRDAGRIHDPALKTLPKLDITVDPVTIDSAPDSWHDKQAKRVARRSDDLVMKIS